MVDEYEIFPGPFVAALEYAAGVTSEVVGKPEAAFFQEALRTTQSEPSTTVMIGDVSMRLANIFVIMAVTGGPPGGLQRPFFFLLYSYLTIISTRMLSSDSAHNVILIHGCSNNNNTHHCLPYGFNRHSGNRDAAAKFARTLVAHIYKHCSDIPSMYIMC